MRFFEDEIFHIYNRGNHKDKIFYGSSHYESFLDKVKEFICPRCSLLNWSLMPNHFHMLIYATEISVQPLPKARIPIQYLSEGIRLLLSSYTKIINKDLNMTGNLFQQKTKAKCTSYDNYSDIAFNYIHQNPYRAGLVQRMEDWEYSSFRDYLNLTERSLCNKKLAWELLGVGGERFYEESYADLPDEKIQKIFERGFRV